MSEKVKRLREVLSALTQMDGAVPGYCGICGFVREHGSNCDAGRVLAETESLVADIQTLEALELDAAKRKP